MKASELKVGDEVFYVYLGPKSPIFVAKVVKITPKEIVVQEKLGENLYAEKCHIREGMGGTLFPMTEENKRIFREIVERKEKIGQLGEEIDNFWKKLERIGWGER